MSSTLGFKTNTSSDQKHTGTICERSPVHAEWDVISTGSTIKLLSLQISFIHYEPGQL